MITIHRKIYYTQNFHFKFGKNNDIMLQFSLSQRNIMEYQRNVGLVTKTVFLSKYYITIALIFQSI